MLDYVIEKMLVGVLAHSRKLLVQGGLSEMSFSLRQWIVFLRLRELDSSVLSESTSSTCTTMGTDMLLWYSPAGETKLEKNNNNSHNFWQHPLKLI